MALRELTAEYVPRGGVLARCLVFQRGLALLYLFAFFIAAFQFRSLAGEDGLLPLQWYAEGAALCERPSLFFFSPSVRTIVVVAWTGVALSALALMGLPYWLLEPSPTPARFSDRWTNYYAINEAREEAIQERPQWEEQCVEM